MSNKIKQRDNGRAAARDYFENATINVLNNKKEIKINFDFDFFLPSPPEQTALFEQINNCVLHHQEFEFTAKNIDQSDLLLFYLYSNKLNIFIQNSITEHKNQTSYKPIISEDLFYSLLDELSLEMYEISKNENNEYKIIRDYILNNGHLKKIDDDSFFFQYLNSFNYSRRIKIENQYFTPKTIVDFFELKIESLDPNTYECKIFKTLYELYQKRAHGKNVLLERNELQEYINNHSCSLKTQR